MPSLPITPKTKVGALLEAYPEIEELLISMAPAFEKLRSPVLRRTVAKVATLQQAAMTGDVPVNEIVRRLREAVGQEGSDSGMDDWKGKMPPPPPPDVNAAKPTETVDAGPFIDRGEHPLHEVVAKLKGLRSGERLLLVAPFYPAPLVDAVRPLSTRIWAREDDGTWRLWIEK
ncbi:MAG: DUF1858 domain-containing protein [Bacteroidetes bacterium]|nr:DUF1858 domain-containing protein [Bacteroidota bacterium]